MREAKDKGEMGFRDIVAFNKTMLANQVWKLVQELDSLVAQVLKSKYFTHDYVLEAWLGYKLSFIWKSLYSTFDSLKEGLF